MVRKRVAAAVLPLALAVLPAPVGAQERADFPTSTQRTLTVVATGTVAVERPDERTDAAIAAAVERARLGVAPAALRAARTKAIRLGYAANLHVGELLAVGDVPPSPFGGPANEADAPFGGNRYCRTSTRPVYRQRDGRQVRVGSRRVRRCYVPPAVGMTVSATYAVTPK